MFMEGVLGHVVAQSLDHLFRGRIWRIRLLPCSLLSRSDDIRVSFSAFLRMRDGDGYVLVRSLHRKEAFGPFGGVYKYHTSAARELDAHEFRPQCVGGSTDMERDLRGFIPRRRLLGLTGWFDSGEDREDASICLKRELSEELGEIRVDGSLPPIPQLLSFRLVRRVYEGPARAAGQTYWQYRVFDFFDILEHSDEVRRFVHAVIDAARTHNDLVVASSHDIVTGRAPDGRLIGHHAGYLFGRRRVRPDEPMFADTVSPGQLQ